MKKEMITIAMAENVAAIAYEMGTHRKRDEVYDEVGEDIGGFTGLYDLAVRGGVILEKSLGKLSWDEVEWVETTMNFVDNLFKFLLKEHRPPTDDELYRISMMSLQI